MKKRGEEAILIAVVDGLKGFPEALATAFPDTTVQTCIGNVLPRTYAALFDVLRIVSGAESAGERTQDDLYRAECGRGVGETQCL